MKTITAAKFKDQCLRIIDSVAETRDPVVITKRGRPMVRVVAYTKPSRDSKSLAGSILRESGDPFGTGEKWNADIS
jgi:prevent-host-death family protein